MHPSTLALIQSAIEEDLGSGDITSLYFVPETSQSEGVIVAREAGVMAGIDIALEVIRRIDDQVTVECLIEDGTAFEKGTVLLVLKGSTRSILSAERTTLNFLQRLCGVATQTRRYVDAVKPHPVQVWDTRKTTPGWRLLEKEAVKAGGGTNHRMGLYDHVMVKDNHLASHLSLEQIQASIDRVKAERPEARLQLEADNLEQVASFLKLQGLDMLLLDNMTLDELRQAVALNAGKLWLEASGGITLQTIHDVAGTGVNAISVGALTHSARALDLALDLR